MSKAEKSAEPPTKKRKLGIITQPKVCYKKNMPGGKCVGEEHDEDHCHCFNPDGCGSAAPTESKAAAEADAKIAAATDASIAQVREGILAAFKGGMGDKPIDIVGVSVLAMDHRLDDLVHAVEAQMLWRLKDRSASTDDKTALAEKRKSAATRLGLTQIAQMVVAARHGLPLTRTTTAEVRLS